MSNIKMIPVLAAFVFLLSCKSPGMIVWRAEPTDNFPADRQNATTQTSQEKTTDSEKTVAEVKAELLERLLKDQLSKNAGSEVLQNSKNNQSAAAGSASSSPSVHSRSLPNIWVFSVGVSSFKDTSLNLRYASSDAEGVYQLFRSVKTSPVPMQRAVLLKNQSAAKAEVIKHLVGLMKRAESSDLVIIYLATHALPDPDTGEINFVMHDTDLNNLVGTGLSQSDIDRIIQRARARKIVFLVDTCHSGGLGNNILLARRGGGIASEVNQLLAQLASSIDGVAVLTASSSNEWSQEDERWNGGVFSYYLMSGLQGRADANRDQVITIREIYDYLYMNVPEATSGNQHPELKGSFSNDLPLIEVSP